MNLEELLARATALEEKAAALAPVELSGDAALIAELEAKVALLEETIDDLEDMGTLPGVDPVADYEAGSDEADAAVAALSAAHEETELGGDFGSDELEAFAAQLDDEADEADGEKGYDFDDFADLVDAGDAAPAEVKAAPVDDSEVLSEMELLQARRAQLGA